MYLHVKINEKYHGDFGFALVINGEKHYFYFIVVPFGIESATELMAALIKPYKYFIHSKGCDMSVYIDDMIEVIDTFLQCHFMHRFIKKLIAMGGWEVNLTKSSIFPSQKILYLGFELNTLAMRITAPIVKILRLCKYIDEMIQYHSDKIKAECRFIAKILGNVVHLLQSHGDVLRICSRASQHEMGKSVTQTCWDSDMEITDNMVREMHLVKHYLHK